MPDMDGVTATEIISSTVPGSPIIMMSVQGERDYLLRSMLAGARELLVKPFSAGELVNAVRHVHELEKVKRARYAQAAYVDGKVQGRLRPPGIRPKFSEKFEAAGVKLPPSAFGDMIACLLR